MAHISITAVLQLLATVFLFVAMSALCPFAIADTDPCEGKAPVVTHGAFKRTGDAEASILTHRFLIRSDDKTEMDVADSYRSFKMTEEITRVLAAIRTGWPDVAEVTARPQWEPGTLIIGLEPSLFESVSLGLPEEGNSVPLCTGHAEFDALNAAVGLQAVELLTLKYAPSIVIRFDPRRNIHLTGASYENIRGVKYARPDSSIGDGPDIQALRSAGKWYMVFRKAWGDCPSGCLFSELYFFIEHNGDVKRVGPERAAVMAEFAEILADRVWRQRPERR